MANIITDAQLIETLKLLHKHGTIAAVARNLDLARSTVSDRINYARSRGYTHKSVAPPEPLPPPPSPPPEPADQIKLRKLQDQLRTESTNRKSVELFASQNQTIREAVFGLNASPPKPPNWTPRIEKVDRVGEVALAMISDWHVGETIDLQQMGGSNSYNQNIARLRAQRYFQTLVSLMTTHWSGPPPTTMYLLLMGDMVSGEIHEELAKTNDLLSIPAVRAASEMLIGGFELLLKSFPKTRFHVVSIAGNHGRTTRKPESKGFVVDSYDTLVTWCIESWFAAKGEKRIDFSAPASGDALINIYGWNFLVTHGDRIGSRGGTGFVGPAATISRGFQKVLMDYAAQGIVIDSILIGHFHSAMELSLGFANGCLPGPSEFSKTFRMRPEPASQWLLTVHPSHGVARRWKVQVGAPSEGQIYRGRT